MISYYNALNIFSSNNWEITICDKHKKKTRGKSNTCSKDNDMHFVNEMTSNRTKISLFIKFHSCLYCFQCKKNVVSFITKALRSWIFKMQFNLLNFNWFRIIENSPLINTTFPFFVCLLIYYFWRGFYISRKLWKLYKNQKSHKVKFLILIFQKRAFNFFFLLHIQTNLR